MIIRTPENNQGTDYIYTRVSTVKQETQTQVDMLLKRYPNAKVIQETKSTKYKRRKLDDLLAKLKPGDRLIIWRLDRMVRTVAQFCNIVEFLIKNDIVFIAEEQGIDLSTASGRLMGNVLASMAQFERDLISSRAKESCARRKEQTTKDNKAILARGGTIPKKASPTGGRGKPRVFHSPIKINFLFELHAKGLNWKEISYELRAHNKKWDMSAQTCYRLFKRERRSREVPRLKIV